MGRWWEFGGGVNGSTLGILVGLMFHFMITTIYFKHVSTKTLLELWVQCVDSCKTTHIKLVGQHAHGMQCVKQHAKVLVWGESCNGSL
jgi:hypothetical protein